MQMVEVCVRNHYCIDRRQVPHTKPRPAQALQYKNPLREVRINDKVLPTDLQKETGVPDKRHTQLAPRGQYGFNSFTCAGSQDRAPDERPDLFGFTPDCDGCHLLPLDAIELLGDARRPDGVSRELS